MKTFRKGGIHPPENKLTAGIPISDIPVPGEFIIMLSQCIGAPSKPIVKAGDKVSVGTLIAEAGGFVGASIHSPVNGTVKKIESVRTPQGLWQDAINITPDTENPYYLEINPRSPEEIESLTPEEIVKIVGDAGIVGMGGATFPTRVKLSIPPGKKAEKVLLNGAECEPYLTCDDRLMIEDAKGIILGALLTMKATSSKEIIIGIEENKPDAISSIQKAIIETNSGDRVKVSVLKKKYPQGSEKQLIYAMTGKTVPAGALPIETGCIVDNVATSYAIYEAVYLRKPLVERIVTVTGKGFTNPGNFRVRIGTSISFLIEQAGGLPDNAEIGKVVAGGPMMGRAVSELESYSTKGLSGVLYLPAEMTIRKTIQPCIRCSRCITVCPMGLEPYLYMQLAEVKYWEEMASHGVMNCLECGCCSYACPASRPLLDMIKLGKGQLRKKK